MIKGSREGAFLYKITKKSHSLQNWIVCGVESVEIEVQNIGEVYTDSLVRIFSHFLSYVGIDP